MGLRLATIGSLLSVKNNNALLRYKRGEVFVSLKQFTQQANERYRKRFKVLTKEEKEHIKKIVQRSRRTEIVKLLVLVFISGILVFGTFYYLLFVADLSPVWEFFARPLSED